MQLTLSNQAPEFRGFGLVLVDEGLLNIVRGVELGRLLGRGLGLGLGIVAGQNATVFGLDGPDAPLVVHLRPGILATPPTQIRIPCRGSRLLRRHCFCSFCFSSFCFCWGWWHKTLTMVYICAWKRTVLLFLLGRALWKYSFVLGFARWTPAFFSKCQNYPSFVLGVHERVVRKRLMDQVNSYVDILNIRINLIHKILRDQLDP